MSEIDNGLRADIMRKRMEDKNTLSHKGSLYVGTGEKETINGVDIYKTQELQAPTETSFLSFEESTQEIQWNSFNKELQSKVNNTKNQDSQATTPLNRLGEETIYIKNSNVDSDGLQITLNNSFSFIIFDILDDSAKHHYYNFGLIDDIDGFLYGSSFSKKFYFFDSSGGMFSAGLNYNHVVDSYFIEFDDKIVDKSTSTYKLKYEIHFWINQ